MGIRSAVAPILLAAALLTSGCSATGGVAGEGESENQGASVAQGEMQGGTDTVEATLAALGLSSDDPRGIIEALDKLPLNERPSQLMASVMPTELRLQPGQPDETALPLEPGHFYLSIAPYREQTHPCTFHSLTTCVGEMGDAEISLRITDPATGEILRDEATRTENNGFVGVWLPADREFEIEIIAGGDTGAVHVGTGAGDPTCLTTVQLS